MIKKILEEGKKVGFSAIEVFRKKTEKTIHKDENIQKTIHTINTDNIIIRAFRNTGSPVGFIISTPDIKKIREAFHTMYSAYIPDNRKNYAQLLPGKIQNVNINIFDEDSYKAIDKNSFLELKEKLFETQVALFPGLKIERVNFSKMLKKVYITNTMMFDTSKPKAKYNKTSFNIDILFSYKGNLIETTNNKPSFSQIDHSRIVSRAYNLLNSLTENTKVSVPVDHLLLSPEASSTILREFSEYFKLNSKKKLKNISFPQALTIIDNPQLNEQSNFFPFDDEGVQSSENFLIEKGFIKEQITNIQSGFENKKYSTGNGFRTDSSIFPEIKFTNLYIKPSTFPFSTLHSDAGKGILISLIKLVRIEENMYTFSAYGYEFSNDDINRDRPIHIYLKTSIEAYFLNILKVSKEIRFFYNKINVGSPYILLEPGKKTGNLFEL